MNICQYVTPNKNQNARFVVEYTFVKLRLWRKNIMSKFSRLAFKWNYLSEYFPEQNSHYSAFLSTWALLIKSLPFGSIYASNQEIIFKQSKKLLLNNLFKYTWNKMMSKVIIVKLLIMCNIYKILVFYERDSINQWVIQLYLKLQY